MKAAGNYNTDRPYLLRKAQLRARLRQHYSRVEKIEQLKHYIETENGFELLKRGRTNTR